VQEAADILIKTFKGKRYFKSTRDRLWKSHTGEHVRSRIHKQLGHEVENVDVAFDYCLSLTQHIFSKRDMFVASSDLARSLIVVSCLGIAPLVRLILDMNMRKSVGASLFAFGILLLAVTSSVFWTRMTRFRELSEKPVFHAYLAHADGTTKSGELQTR
jgi:hypothetical protein